VGSGDLRKRAENQLRVQPTGASRKENDHDAQRILHELQVHQIELELQNEELQRAMAEIDAGLEKYTDLYEYAPAGYYTLSRDGIIQLMNFAGAAMLGIDRSRLIGRRFGLLISPEHRSAFNAFLKRAFVFRDKISGEFELISQGQWPQTVRIEAQRLPNEVDCRAVVVDISEHKRAEETQRRLNAATVTNSRLQKEIIRREAVEAALRRSEEVARRLLEESNNMQRRLRDMSRRILLVQEEQRKTISRELHDQISQTLVGINIYMTAFAKSVKTNPKNIERSAAPMMRLVTKAVEIVHRFAQDLRPPMLDELGLITSLISYIRAFPKPKGLRIQFRAFASEVPLDNEKRTVLFRVAQEALVNVGKHAKAANVKVSVLRVPGGVCLEIADDGKSFDISHMATERWSNRLGLVGMRERVEMVGGKFSIESAKGVGTTVQATVPMGKTRLNV
jgi:PAS domain S-box-containing protein